VASAPALAEAPTIGGFGVQPLQRDHARGYFVFHLRPGAVHRARVEVLNADATPITLWVDGVDGLTGVTSGVVYANRGVRARGAGTWITPDFTKLTLAPHSRRSLGFAVTVPASATPGDHVGGIAFQDANPVTSGGRFQITEIVRAVVGVEVKIPGPASQQLLVGSLTLGTLPGTSMPAVTVPLTDSGRLLCKPRLIVTVDGPSGVESQTRALDTLLPGDKIAYPFAWRHALSPGSYTLRARSANCGAAAAARGRAQLTRRLNPHAPPTKAVRVGVGPVSASSNWWLLVLAGAGGLAIGGVAVLVGVRIGLARSRP